MKGRDPILKSNAYIKLVSGSSKTSVTADELKALFHYYKEITTKTGTQVDWNYNQVAFPYEIKEFPNQQDNGFYLFSDQDRYHSMIIGIDKEMTLDENGNPHKQTSIQITLTDQSTYGDKGKANEFCKFLAKKLQGDLHLFNGRIMYYSR
jgi:hypothetical protein